MVSQDSSRQTHPKQRVVIKFGSGILAALDGLSLDRAQISSLVQQVAKLVAAGHECILVSSGAVAAGLMEMNRTERPGGLAQVQALAAIGQSRLMAIYQTQFAEEQLRVAQLLLTHQDLDSRLRYRNAKNTLEELLRQPGVVPIINENDSVAVEELKFGDNDELSAEVAVLCKADRLVLLTTVDGLTDSPDGTGEVIPEVTDIAKVQHLVGDAKGRHSVGGMHSKLMAVQTAVEAGIPTVIANGRTDGILSSLLEDTAAAGRPPGTHFPAANPSREAVNSERRRDA